MEAAKKYAVLYADPPWHYDMKRGNGVAENHYPTMSIEETCAYRCAYQLGYYVENAFLTAHTSGKEHGN